MKPTPEQQNCVELFKTGQRLRINAYAGAGKTSTLKLLAKATPKAGTYVAFNKSIADDARRAFTPNVACSTMHSLAFRAMVRHYGPEKMTGSVNGGFLAAKLNLREVEAAPKFYIRPRSWGWLVAETVKRWQRSGKAMIDTADVPVDGKLGTLPPATLSSIRHRIVKEAEALWERMIDKSSDIPMGHDGYLKLWALGKPALPGRFILLDEAQDTNGVVLELMRHQEAQVVCVGDKHQAIYEWRGALNAMVELPADVEARLSQSFRFGTAIGDYATVILKLLGETLPLRGFEQIDSRIGEIEKPTAILARTNSRLIEELFGHLEAGRKPHIVGGTSEVMQYVTAAERLQAGQSVDSPLEFFGFNDWAEVEMVANSEEGTPDLRRWVKLIGDHGTEKLKRALEGLPRDERNADVVLSTAHKSKGREWPEVRLLDDMLLGVRTERQNQTKQALDSLVPPDPAGHAAELRLYYVAATRGQKAIEVPPTLADKIDALIERRKAA